MYRQSSRPANGGSLGPVFCFGGCSSLFSQPVALSVFSFGNGPNSDTRLGSGRSRALRRFFRASNAHRLPRTARCVVGRGPDREVAQGAACGSCAGLTVGSADLQAVIADLLSGQFCDRCGSSPPQCGRFSDLGSIDERGHDVRDVPILFSNSGSGCQALQRSSLPGPLFSPR